MQQPPAIPENHDPGYWHSHGQNWRRRAASLALGIAMGIALLVWTDNRRIVPDEVGLGVENWAAPALFQGERINAWRLEDYAAYYPVADAGATDDILWVGNSQLHAINQIRRGRDQVAAFHASAGLNQPVRCLSLPNANIQEHLVTLRWAKTRRPVRWLVLPLVFDKLRNDGLRAGFERLDSPELEAGLEQRPAGKRLSGEMAAMARTARDAQGTATRPLQEYSLAEWLHGLSLQDVSEHQLDGMLAGHAGLWQRRGLLWATILNDAYEFRNWALRIKSTSKRPMLPVPFEKNMAAFEEILDVAAAQGVNVLVYIAPIRHDVEPPYIMAEYLPWKARVAQIVASRAGQGGSQLALADLDQLVSNELWGTVEGSEAIDFMHFQGDAHVQLGEKIAALLAGMGAGREGQD